MNRTGLPSGTTVKLLDAELLIDHRMITPRHPEWPAILNELGSDAPRRLQVSGQTLEPERMMLAIVGSRRPTAVGMAMAEKFGSELAEAGFTIVSGLATGVDAIAHKAALAAGGVDNVSVGVFVMVEDQPAVGTLRTTRSIKLNVV